MIGVRCIDGRIFLETASTVSTHTTRDQGKPLSLSPRFLAGGLSARPLRLAEKKLEGKWFGRRIEYQKNWWDDQTTDELRL